MWYQDLRYIGQPVLGRFTQGFVRPPSASHFKKLDTYYDVLGEVIGIDFGSIDVKIKLFADTFPVPFFYIYRTYFSVLKNILSRSGYGDRAEHMERMVRKSLDEIQQYHQFPVFFYGHINEYQNIVFPTYPVYFTSNHEAPLDFMSMDLPDLNGKVADLIFPFVEVFKSYVSDNPILVVGPKESVDRIVQGHLNWSLLDYLEMVFFVDYMRYFQDRISSEALFFPFFYSDYRFYEYTVQYPNLKVPLSNDIEYFREASVRTSYPFYHMFQYYGTATIYDVSNLFRYYNYTTGYLGTLSFMHPMFVPMARRLARDVLLWNVSRGIVGDILNENPMRQVSVGEYNVFFNPFFSDAFVYYDEDGAVKMVKSDLERYDSTPVTVTAMMITSDAFRRVKVDYKLLLEKAQQMEDNERFQRYFKKRTGQEFMAAEITIDGSVVDDLLKKI